ncbi:hypothetical protein BD779DRAFT_1514639 [Infundibulicybe gibba]|nr:hypothetical protein BD779DRAFT_1514639 [Infundibulicybe gibba]
MYMKLTRIAPAEQARGKKRAAAVSGLPLGTGALSNKASSDGDGDGDDDDDDDDDNRRSKTIMTVPAHPTTITITKLVLPQSTVETTTTSMVPMSMSTSILPPSSTGISSSSPGLQSSSAAVSTAVSVSSTSPPSSPVIVVASATTKSQSNGGGKSNQDTSSSNKQPENSGLPAGAIAGIIIAALLIIIAVIVLVVRKRLIRRRRNIRATWAPFTAESSFRNADISPPSYAASTHAATITPYPVATFVTPQPQFVSRVPVPLAMASPTVAAIPAVLTPGRTPRSATESLPDVTVVCSFIPTLQDELPIEAGERIRVMAEYDDGWALCCNSWNQQGMVPLECLDRGSAPTESRDYRRFKRASSLHASLIPGERPYASQ